MRRWLIKTSIVGLLFLASGCGSDSRGANFPIGRPIVPTRVTPTASFTPTSQPTSMFTLTPSATRTEIPVTPTLEITEDITEVVMAFTDTPAPSGSPAATRTEAATSTGSPTFDETGTPSTLLTLTVMPSSVSSVSPTATTSPTITASQTLIASSSDTPSPTHTPSPTSAPPTATFTLTATASPTAILISYFDDATAFQVPRIGGELTLSNTGTGTISSDSPAVVFTFVGSAGQTVDVSLSNESGNLDPLLLVLSGKGEELARNDDLSANLRDSGITAFKLPEDDLYYIVATRYLGQYGFTEGEFTLTVSENNGDEAFGFFTESLPFDDAVRGALTDDRTEQFYTFRARAGDVIDIEMTAGTEALDPFIGLTDNLGNLLISDDDIGGGSFDALIDDFIIQKDGYYTVLASQYGSGENAVRGDYRLELRLESRNGFSGDYPIDAVLNPQNSGTIRADNQLFRGFSPGDMLDDNNREQRLQALITFILPPHLSADQVTDAQLYFSPCYITGDGTDILGDFTLYLDNYGLMNENRDFTRPGTGARIITQQVECTPIDLTDTIRDALDAGQTVAQFRITFRENQTNGEADQLRLTDPRLRITFNP